MCECWTNSWYIGVLVHVPSQAFSYISKQGVVPRYSSTFIYSTFLSIIKCVCTYAVATSWAQPYLTTHIPTHIHTQTHVYCERVTNMYVVTTMVYVNYVGCLYVKETKRKYLSGRSCAHLYIIYINLKYTNVEQV